MAGTLVRRTLMGAAVAMALGFAGTSTAQADDCGFRGYRGYGGYGGYGGYSSYREYRGYRDFYGPSYSYGHSYSSFPGRGYCAPAPRFCGPRPYAYSSSYSWGRSYYPRPSVGFSFSYGGGRGFRGYRHCR